MPLGLFQRAGRVISTPIRADINTAFTGTRFLLTFAQVLWPGTAPSRENANIILEHEVKQAVAQKSCPAEDMIITNLKREGLRELFRMEITEPAPNGLIAGSNELTDA